MPDFRHAVRSLRSAPGLTVAAVLLLALGIGSSLGLFLILNALVLRPLPVQEPDRLVSLSANPNRVSFWSYAIWQEVEQRKYFENAFAWAPVRVGAVFNGQPSTVDAGLASHQIWKTLGIAPSLGTEFGLTARGGELHALISDRVWRRQFEGREDVIGQTIRVEGIEFSLAGVMPASFFGPEVGKKVDLILPLDAEPRLKGVGNSFIRQPTAFFLNIIGRLGPDQSEQIVRERLKTDARELRLKALPRTLSAQQAERFLSQPVSIVSASNGISMLRTKYAQPLRRLTWLLFAALVLACISVASLSLARTEGKLGDWRLRLFLGASRSRLLRLILIEGSLLAGAGTLTGLVLAVVLSRILVSQFQTSQGVADFGIPLDWRGAVVCSAIMIFSTLVITIVPFLKSRTLLTARSVRPAGWMRGRIRFTAAASLVVLQLATGTVLIVAAVVFLRSAYSLLSRDLGFDPEKMLVVRFDIAKAAGSAEERLRLLRQLAGTVARVPGTEAASASAITPASNTRWQWDIRVDPDSVPPRDAEIHVNVVEPGWFRTYGTPLRLGRDFTEADVEGRRPVAIVNEEFTRRYLAGNPLSARIQLARADSTHHQLLEVVGIVADAVYETPREASVPVLFVPLTQYKPALGWASISIRTTDAAPRFPIAVVNALSKIEPRITYETLSLDAQVRALSAQERLLAIISFWAGIAAALFASLSVFAMTAHRFGVCQNDLRIRLALGADPGTLRRQWLLQQVAAAAIGATIGIVSSAVLFRFVQSFLYGAPPNDAAVLASCWLFVTVTAAIATWLPLRGIQHLRLTALVRSDTGS